MIRTCAAGAGDGKQAHADEEEDGCEQTDQREAASEQTLSTESDPPVFYNNTRLFG